MKKFIVLFSILVLLLSLSVNANHKPKNELNKECQDFGFTFGVAKWKWEKKMWLPWKKNWVPEEDGLDTSVTGTHNVANWDVGGWDDFGTTGIVVESGKKHYAVNGATGIVTEDNPIEHITFCFKPQCVGGAPGS